MTEPVIIGQTWDHAWAHPIGRVQTSVGQAGTVWNWSADPDALREYLGATLGGHKPQSRWQRILEWFGLAKPAAPYTHSFVPIVVGPPAEVTELWGDWTWAENGFPAGSFTPTFGVHQPFVCSRCGHDVGWVPKGTTFCPICGACPLATRGKPLDYRYRT